MVGFLEKTPGLAITADFHSELRNALTLLREISKLKSQGWAIADVGDFLNHDLLHPSGVAGSWDTCMLKAMFDFAVPGNHGFSGFSSRCYEPARFLCSNLEFDASTGIVPLNSAVINVQGLMTALIGVIGEQAFDAIPVRIREGVRWLAPVQAIRTEIEKLRSTAKAVVVLSHSGLHTDIKLFEGLLGANIVISSHCHSSSYVETRNGIRFFKPLEYGRGILQLTRSEKDSSSLEVASYHFPNDIVEETNSKTDTEAYIENLIRNAISAKTNHQTIAVGCWTEAPLGPRELCEKVAQALAEETGSAVLLNATCFRSVLQTGTVTSQDICEIEPYNNQLVITELSWEKLSALQLPNELFWLIALPSPAYTTADKPTTLITTTYLKENYLDRFAGRLPGSLITCLRSVIIRFINSE